MNIALTGAVCSETSLEVHAATTLEQWKQLGAELGAIERGSRWWVGDWILFGETSYNGDTNERYTEAERVTGLDHGTLLNVRYICAKVSQERRRKDLGFWIHAEVAKLDPQGQVDWLARAADNGWTKAELRRSISAGGRPLAHMTPTSRLNHAARQVVAASRPRLRGGYVVRAEDLELLAEAAGVELPKMVKVAVAV